MRLNSESTVKEYICLDCTKSFNEPHENCPACGESMSPHANVPKGVRYGAFEVKTKCPHCGNPLILGGPTQKATCNSCQKDVDIPASLWKSIFEDLEEDYHEFRWGSSRSCTMMTQGFTLEIVYGQQVPHCPECSKIMPADEIEVGEDRVLRCVKCEEPLQTFPAPAWLKKVFPSAVQLYAAERHASETPPEAVDASAADKASPVVMACPQCGAALKVTTDTERITGCQYCNVDVFLPDELWLRMHPVKTVRRFVVRFEGKTPKQLEEEAERREEAARLVREKEENERREAKEKAEQEEKAANEAQKKEERRKHRRRFWWCYAATVLLLTVFAAIVIIVRS